MGACASRPQKQQREWTAATNKPRKHGIGALWKNKGIQQQQIGGGGGGTSTTPIFRCTDEASSTTATTSSSANPKTFNAPQAAARSPEENVPFEILRGSIFPFLSGVCLARAGSTCRSWGEASVDEHLWKALCLKRWAGKHVALLEDDQQQQEVEEPGVRPEAASPSSSPSAVQGRRSAGGEDPEEEHRQRRRQRQRQQERRRRWQRRRRRQRALERAGRLRGGLEEIVAAMPIRVMKRRLAEMGANPSRLETCLEKDECVSLMLGAMLLSREGLLREKGRMPAWVSRLRGWRWSYHFANKDSRRCWLTMADVARTRWTMSFPEDMPLAAAAPPPPSTPPPPTVACEFHRDFSYTDEGFHQDGLAWHFEDGRRCVKVSHYPALEAERDASWGWRLVNPHVIFEQQRAQP